MLNRVPHASVSNVLCVYVLIGKGILLFDLLMFDYYPYPFSFLSLPSLCVVLYNNTWLLLHFLRDMSST